MNKEVMNNRREEISQKIDALSIESNQISEAKELMKTQILESVFSGMDLIEGTELAINSRGVRLVNVESGFDLAKLTVEREFLDFSSFTRTTVVNFRFNGGGTEEVKFLASMANFIEVASTNKEFIVQEFDKSRDFLSDIKKEVSDEIRTLEREFSDIRMSMIKEVEDSILDQMKSDKGFDLVSTRLPGDVEFPFINRDSLTVSFNFTVNSLSNLKIVDMTKSGKTATVVITQESFNGTPHSFTEKVRMNNVLALVNSQRRKLEDVEKGDKVFA